MSDTSSWLVIGAVGALLVWLWFGWHDAAPPGPEPELIAKSFNANIYRIKVNGVSYLFNSSGGIVKEENQNVR